MSTYKKNNLVNLSTQSNEGDSLIWMLPYSTLMLVLMIMFSALYSYSYQNSLEYERALSKLDPEHSSPLTKEIDLVEGMQSFIKSMNLQGIAEISITAHEIKLRLASPTVFDIGSAEIKPDVMPLLIKLLGFLNDMDNRIIVEGHTDNIPIHNVRYGSNWELSSARAFSVIYFYLKRGVAPHRLVAHGFGEHKSLFPNSTQFGRAMNRRIEITIIREKQN